MGRSAHLRPAPAPGPPSNRTRAQHAALSTFEGHLREHRDRRNKPIGAGTQATYVRNVARAMREAKSTDPDVLIKWLHERVNPRTAHGTANPMLYAIRHYAASCAVRSNPADRDALDRAQNPKRYPYLGALARGSRDALTDEETAEYQRVVGESGIPSQVHAILLLLPATGLRVSEACKLRRCDVQKRGGRLGLVVLGKGSKVRWVPCNAFGGEAATVLREYDAAIVKGKDASASPLFPSLRGGAERPVTIGTVEGHLKRLREESWTEDEGRLATVTPHVLRHTCATRLLRAKVPIELVQRILGHSDIATTLRYSHPTDDDLANALD